MLYRVSESPESLVLTTSWKPSLGVKMSWMSHEKLGTEMRQSRQAISTTSETMGKFNSYQQLQLGNETLLVKFSNFDQLPESITEKKEFIIQDPPLLDMVLKESVSSNNQRVAQKDMRLLMQVQKISKQLDRLVKNATVFY
uniref:Uncharacterized protein n=1 Tax=Cacopsylla melanoneura TaxID=428564 RepID=A0A8D9AG56_9HEMI